MIFENGHIYHTILVSKLYNLTRQMVLMCDKIIYSFMAEHKQCNNLNDQNLNLLFAFNSKYYGKNNLFINSNDHRTMLGWIKERLNHSLSEINVAIQNSNTNSIINRKTELEERLDIINSLIKSSNN